MGWFSGRSDSRPPGRLALATHAFALSLKTGEVLIVARSAGTPPSESEIARANQAQAGLVDAVVAALRVNTPASFIRQTILDSALTNITKQGASPLGEQIVADVLNVLESMQGLAGGQAGLEKWALRKMEERESQSSEMTNDLGNASPPAEA